MIQEFRKRIGVKLFVLLMALIALALVPLFYVVFSAVSYFGQYTADANRDEVKGQAYSYLGVISREQAHALDAFFSHVEVTSSLMAAQAREIYDNLEYYAAFPDSQIQLMKSGESGVYVTPPNQEVHTLFYGKQSIPEQDMTEMRALSRLDPVFKGVQRELPESDATHMVTTTGISRYMAHLQNGREVRPGLVSVDHYLRMAESLTLFSELPGAVSQGTMWSPIFRDSVTDILLITASSPVTDRDGLLRGTIGVDIPLVTVLSRLGMKPGRYGDWISETLFSFLLDEKGRIIAFPTEYLGLFGITTEADVSGETGDVFNLFLSDSTSALMVDAVPKLLSTVSETVEVELNNATYILNMHPLHRLNWHLVMVTREGQLLTSVDRTEQALSGTLLLLVNRFIANAILIILILLVVVFFAVGYFVAPLKKLSEAALLVGKGDLKTRCHLNRDDELGILAHSFNNMVRQLEAAEKIQKSQAKQLELTVLERTRDLRNKNFVLRDVISELNAESERRIRAVEALKKSEERIHLVMDASLAGHGIIQDKQVRYVNSMASRVFGYSREEMTSGAFGVAELVVAGQYQRVQKELLGRFSDTEGRPYVVECRRKDGSVFDALVGGAVTTWEGKHAIVVTVMDISDQKQAEEELRKSKLLLQDSLAEKEVLLREIYHRTKNNMLVIISMLHLQAMEIDDERVKSLFWETENRIRAMSLVHEKLYQSKNLAEIDLGQYLEEMVTALVRSMVVGNHVQVEIQREAVLISIDNIVPLGLAINEIVTNSLKHAFPSGRRGHIFVRLTQDMDGLVQVVVGDDGVGLPGGMDLSRVHSFGMQITSNLIKKQLHGTMDIQSGDGVVYQIRFTEPVRVKRV